jgi:hypothetical protein
MSTIYDTAAMGNSRFFGITAATCGNITYIRNYKCASSFFYNNFVHNFKWNVVSFAEINWAGKVFSHIVDPIDRRHKGIVQWLKMNNLVNEYNKSAEFRLLVNNVCFLDIHSVSYHSLFGEYCNSIDWIPSDKLPDDVVQQMTERLLVDSGLIRFQWDHGPTYINASSPEEKEAELRIKNDFNEAWKSRDMIHQNFEIYKYFEKDLSLYSTVLRKFNPHGDTWKNTSWLT